MDDNAPFVVSVMQRENGDGRQLQVTFTEQFRNMDPSARYDTLKAYIANLRRQSQAAETDSPEQMGLLTVLQLAEQMLPHIESGEMAVDQSFIAEVVAEQDDSKPLRQHLNS